VAIGRAIGYVQTMTADGAHPPAAVAGCAADFYFGVLLQARVESIENTGGRVFYGDIFRPPAQQVSSVDVPSQLAWGNWATKHSLERAARLLAAIPREAGDQPGFAQAWPGIRAQLEKPFQDDAKDWRGWASRHDDVFSFLGDWAAGDSAFGAGIAALVFCLFFVGMMAALVQAGFGSPRKVRAAPPPARKNRRERGKRRPATEKAPR
jgi:hypothetical protein